MERMASNYHSGLVPKSVMSTLVVVVRPDSEETAKQQLVRKNWM